MSHQDDSEDNLGLFFDMTENCERDYFRTSTPTSSEEVGSTDDTVSKSVAVDLSDGAIDKPSHSKKKAKTTLCIEKDCSGDPHEISHSEMSGSSSLGSLEILFPWLRPRPGIRGFIDRLLYNMRIIRERGYLLPFELLCMGFTILCCFMGAKFWSKCPANPYIPRYVFVNGAIGTFSLCVKVLDSLWKLAFRRSRAWDMWIFFCAFGIGWVAVIGTFVEMSEYYTMPYGFNWDEKHYCNYEFYWFVHYKIITFGVLVSMAALIYIPSIDVGYYYVFFV